jgi:hypothetical protein
VGEYSDTTFTITNTGGGTLSGTVSESCDDFSLVGPTDYNLGAGESDTFTVRFEPLFSGPKNCTVETGNDACTDVSCTGTGKSFPSAPTGCAASDDLCDSVHFSWTDNSGDETGFYIYRDAAKLDSVGANVVSYDDLTGTPGQTYIYSVSAYNDCGESSQCSDDGTRQAPPAAPSDCAASDDLCDSVRLCWTDNSDNETGFYIYRDAAKLDSVGVDVNCYDDTAATPGVTYEYCVTAYNECGESSQCCDDGTRKVPPAAPTDCATSDDFCDKVGFTWTDNSDDETGFYLYRDGVALDTLNADVESYDDLTASPGTTHRYCVSAFNNCGVSDSCCVDGTRLALPTTPSNVSVAPGSYTITVSWFDVPNDTGYVVFRGGDTLASLPMDSTSYIDSSFFDNDTLFGEHCYCVSAINACGASDTTSSACTTLYLVAGNVWDENDDPIVGGLVYVSRAARTGSPPSDTLDATVTNSSGNFQFKLPAGSFFIFRDFATFYYEITLPDDTTEGDCLGGKNFENNTDVADLTGTHDLPDHYVLSQNYPNPFNPETQLEFFLPRDCYVELSIYDILGRKVTTLVNQDLSAGLKLISWDGRDENGREVASGIYFYMIKAGTFSDTKKLVLLK